MHVTSIRCNDADLICPPLTLPFATGCMRKVPGGDSRHIDAAMPSERGNSSVAPEMPDGHCPAT
jgi:hypothetical protein